MREILFQGKRLDNGEWVSSGNLITFNDEGEGKQFFIPKMNAKCTCTHDEQDNIISFDSGMFYKVDPDTVGQFTGMTDRSGKKIFEGDIVRVCLDPEICIGDVIWDSEIASYNILFSDGKCVLPLDIFIAKNKVGDKVWIEVIGNIHDNPGIWEGDRDG